MDIEVNTLAQIKAETGRDLDNQVDENTLVSGEKSNGTFGVFKLFAAIKNCIDNWITTIAGAKNFTGAVTINSKAVATTEAVNNALENYQPKFNYVSSQEIQLDNNASYIICSHHPYDSNYNFYGLVLNYNDVITEFIISNSNTDLPYTKNGTKLNFKGGYWLTRIQKIASSINN